MSGATTPLRVVLALESSGPGGAEHMVLQLARELRRLGDAPVIATMRPGWMTERAAKAGIPVWIVPQRPGFDPLWIPRFALRLRRERIDVVHSHEFAMNIYAGAAARLAGLPTVATLHGKHWATEAPAPGARLPRAAPARHEARGRLRGPGRLPRRRTRGAARRDPGRLQRHRAAAAARSGASDRRLRDAVRAELGLAPQAELALAVGNLYPVKDHATLLRAAALRPALAVAIAGRGAEEERLRALAAELGIAERVRLLGLRDDIPRLLAAADVFVQPSLSEGMPLAVLEAMAASLPVVASRVGGVHEAVADGETGRLVPSGRPPELAAALAAVLDSADRGAGLGRAGRRRVEAVFSAPAMAQGLPRPVHGADAPLGLEPGRLVRPW